MLYKLIGDDGNSSSMVEAYEIRILIDILAVGICIILKFVGWITYIDINPGQKSAGEIELFRDRDLASRYGLDAKVHLLDTHDSEPVKAKQPRSS